MAVADKFYTKPDVAKKCYDFLVNTLKLSGDEYFLEPTAGSGVFLDFLKNYEAYDILPEDPRISKMDIFNYVPTRSDLITIGNPPFGKRSRLAVSVFNKVAECSEAVGFVLPVSFMKYGVQKQLSPNFKLVNYFFLPSMSFFDRDKEYDVNCVFQVWVKEGSKYDRFDNLRITEPPPIKHDDFEIWQYNATQEAFGCVDNDWEIAIYRQGYKDYSKLFVRDDKEKVVEMMRNGIQFFFIKPLNDTARNVISKMDFKNLAARNTSIPGFGKADFVSYYLETKIRVDN